MHHSYGVAVWLLNCWASVARLSYASWMLEAAAGVCWLMLLTGKTVCVGTGEQQPPRQGCKRASVAHSKNFSNQIFLICFFKFLKPSGRNFGISLFPAGGKRLIYYNDMQVIRRWFSCGDQTSSYGWTCPLFSKCVLIQREPQTCLQLICVAFLCVALLPPLKDPHFPWFSVLIFTKLSLATPALL